MILGILAHGLGGRVDLPVPRWLFVFGAAAALLLSFVALAGLWKEPRFEHRVERRAKPGRCSRSSTNPTLEWAIRIVALVFAVVVTIAAFLPVGTTETIGPVVVFIWFWVGLAFVQGLFGELVGDVLSPWDTLGRLLAFDEQERLPACRPERVGGVAGRDPAVRVRLARARRPN